MLLEYGADVNAATSTDAAESGSQNMDIGEHEEEEAEETQAITASLMWHSGATCS